MSSVIQNLYENLEATLWILEMTKRSKSVLMSDVDGYQAIIRELDKDLIGKNGIDMLAPKSSITYEMMHMKISLGYLMFLKQKSRVIK